MRRARSPLSSSACNSRACARSASTNHRPSTTLVWGRRFRIDKLALIGLTARYRRGRDGPRREDRELSERFGADGHRARGVSALRQWLPVGLRIVLTGDVAEVLDRAAADPIVCSVTS